MTTPEWNEWTYPHPSKPTSGYLALGAVLLWVAVLVLWFFSGLLWSRIWILAAFIDIGVRAVAILVTTIWIVSLIRHRRWIRSIAVAAIAAGSSRS